MPGRWSEGFRLGDVNRFAWPKPNVRRLNTGYGTKAHINARMKCALYGIEVQFLRDGAFVSGRLFGATLAGSRNPREMALAWAEQERQAH